MTPSFILVRLCLAAFLSIWAGYTAAQEAAPRHETGDPAHWYDLACCSLRDCAPMASSDFYLDDGDVVVVPTGERFPLERVRPSQDGQWHRCVYLTDGTTRVPQGGVCIYAPQSF